MVANEEQTKLLDDHPSVNVDNGNLYLYNTEAIKILQNSICAWMRQGPPKRQKNFLAHSSKFPTISL